MKIRNMILNAAGAAAAVAAVSVHAQQSNNVNVTRPYADTQVQPQIRLNLENETEKVHFIRDNSDPYVVTKTYVLKNADPYELRPYVRAAIRSKKITENNTYVECLKYNDGTGIMIVSAEQDRFGTQENGMGIDEIIAKMDQPKITSSSGTTRFLYFPKYRSAAELYTLIWNVGSTHVYDGTKPIYEMDSFFELQQGQDKVFADPGFNGLFLYVPKWSKKNIMSMLAYYDQPILQAAIRYTVYEIYAENDGKIGADFQSWKNNDGLELLSVGGRYRSNWTSTYAGAIDPGSGNNKTQFFSFNPKWNSKYLDFLAASGKAQVLTSGEVVVRNNQTATIEKTNNIFTDKYVANSTQYVTAWASRTAVTGNVVGTDPTGTNIVVNSTTGTVTVYAVRMKATSSDVARYQLAVEGATFTKDGVDFGRQTVATTVSGFSSFTNDVEVYKGPTINTEAFAIANSGSSYGLVMSIAPQINLDSTSIQVSITNSSLIGWKSSGEPRIAQGNTVNTDIMISNKGNRFVIGGIEKLNVVRSTTGLPFFRSLPGLGWLFSTESESTKKSQLVVVAECNSIAVDAPMTQAISGTIESIKGKTADAGNSNSWGFDQYLIDKAVN